MRLAIADPPYPPIVSAGGRTARATRWYGGGVAADDKPADFHPDAAAWNDWATHRALLEQLCGEYDGWAIATTPDGIAAYGALPPEVRILAWVRLNAQRGAHRLRSCWEAVLLFPPAGRRSNIGVGMVNDVLVAGIPHTGFTGSKPAVWTNWVLDALTFDPTTDTVADLFPGSGAVTAAIHARQPSFDFSPLSSSGSGVTTQ